MQRHASCTAQVILLCCHTACSFFSPPILGKEEEEAMLNAGGRPAGEAHEFKNKTVMVFKIHKNRLINRRNRPKTFATVK
jgi:hypothetical protein